LIIWRFCRPYGTLIILHATQDLRPFDCVQGKLWANVFRPFGAGTVPILTI